MTDLEQQLRAMLRDRAGDIGDLPSALHEFEAVSTSAEGSATSLPTSLATSRAARRSRTSRAWLLSAAAVAVIGAGLAVAVTNHDDAQPHPTTRSDAATRPVDRGGPRTSVALGLPAAATVPGYYQQIAVSKPGFRWIGWQKAATRPPAIGLYDLSPLSAQAVVFDTGQFPLAKVRLTETPIDLALATGSTPVYRTDLQELATGKPESYRRSSLAWQYGKNQWVVVQALSKQVTRTDLEHLAAAVRPTALVPISLPFDLATAPAGILDDIVDRRPGGTLDLHFTAAATSTTLTVGTDPDDVGVRTGTARTVDGLSALVDTNGGAVVDYDGGTLRLDVTSTATGESNLPMVDRLLDGLTWSGRRGAGPGIPLRAAIGH